MKIDQINELNRSAYNKTADKYHDNLKLDFLDTRKPYEFEFNVERIYAIGTKIKQSHLDTGSH
jgi:hypothetical protein